ncbi:MAG: VCBS repeat-containing protein [Verrucomicrobia bacterium]|nr:VCBS repeat-containing protein [Verrucomicrobiota bacterium]
MRIFPLLLALLLVISGGFAQAASPGTAFSYQGRLQEGGAPASGLFDLRLALCDAAEAGSPLALKTNVVAVSNGLFTTTLDFGSGVFNGEARWLEIGVRTNGSGEGFVMLAPRQALPPVPHALFATSAGVAGSVTGQIAENQLPATVARLTGNQTFTGPVSFVNLANQFAGNGAGLLGVNLANVYSGGAVAMTHSFTLAASPVVGTNPAAVVTADLNRDGWPDCVSANFSENTLTVLTNDGRGNLGPASTVPTAATPLALALGDFNADGHPDLACVHPFAQRVSVLTNNGAGALTAAGLWATGSSPSDLAVGDLNGDGRPDLAIANGGEQTLSILLNQGNARFTLTAMPPLAASPFGVAAADVNSDGTIDLACVLASENQIVVLTNDGSAGFRVAGTAPTGEWPRSVIAADVNFDAHPDLLAPSLNDNTVSVLTNNGHGVFLSACLPAVGAEPVSVALADVNADLRPDLVCVNHGGPTLSLLTNAGGGAFRSMATLTTGNGPAVVATTDVNRDGRTDLISANYSANTLSIFLAGQRAAFNGSFDGAFAGSFTGNGAGLSALPAGSLTGTIADARLSRNVALLDAAQTFTQANRLEHAANRFAGRFAGRFIGNGAALTNVPMSALSTGSALRASNSLDAPFWLTVGDSPRAAVVVDFNRDGLPDLVSADYFDGGVTVMTNAGGTNFVVASHDAAHAGTVALAAGDFNGDSWPDLAAANRTDNSVSLLLNDQGARYFRHDSWPVATNPAAVVAFDVIGDGRLGFVVASDGGESALTVFTPSDRPGELFRPLMAGAGKRADFLAAADVNGDGRIDCLTARNDEVLVFTNAGAGVFLLGARYEVGHDARGLGIGDFNQDSEPDFVTVSRAEYVAQVFTNDTRGRFALATTVPTDPYPNALLVTDFNGDGRLDLVVTCNGESLTLFADRGANQFQRYATLETHDCFSLADGDLNGDGRMDLVSAHPNHDLLGVFLSRLLLTTSGQFSGSFAGDGAGLTGVVPTSNSVDTAALTASAVTTANLADRSVTTSKLADEAVTTIKLAPQSVMRPQIADNAVNGLKLADGAVNTNHLSASAVTAAHLRSDPQSLARVSGGVMHNSGGAIGIGTESPGYTLHVNGSVAGVGNYNALSDARYKTNVMPLTNALAKVLALRGVSFDWRRTEFPEKNFSTARQLGLIAQDVASVVPEAVTQDAAGDHSLAYADLVPLLIEAIQEQQRAVRANEAEIRTLKELLKNPSRWPISSQTVNTLNGR